MSKHTPGPWESEYLGDGQFEVLANGGNRDDVACICSVAGGLGMSIEDGWDYESEANAKLIAASPELLEAVCKLQMVVEEWMPSHDEENGPSPADWAKEILEFSRAAIAKTKGQTNVRD